MLKYVIIGIVVGLPILIISVLRGVLPRVAESQDLADKWFVCPNCGKKFQVKWQKVYFNRLTIYMYKSMKAKCPHCGTKDMCFQERD